MNGWGMFFLGLVVATCFWGCVIVIIENRDGSK